MKSDAYLSRLFAWVQDHNIQNIIDNVEKYEQINSLCIMEYNRIPPSVAQNNSTPQQLFYIPNCKIVAINEKHFYIACNKCRKKVLTNIFCQFCGKIDKSGVSKMLYIMATIGDNSLCRQAMWGHDEAQLLIGDEG